MNKLFTKIASLSVGLALAVGVGVAVGGSKSTVTASAAEKLVYTLDGTVTGGTSGYASESEITQGVHSWKVTGNTTMNPWRIGGNTLTSIDRPLYSTTSFSNTISKVELTVGAASNITVNSLKLQVASNSGFEPLVETVTRTFAANSTITFSGSEDWTNCYFKIIFNVSVSGSSNRFVQVSSVKFYEESAAPRGELLINDLDSRVLFKDDSDSLSYSWTPASGDSATITSYTWSSSDSAVISVSGNTYTAVAPGSAKIILNATDSNGEEYTVETEKYFVSNEYDFEVGDTVVLYSEDALNELSGIYQGKTHYGVGAAYVDTPNCVFPLTVEAGTTSGSLSFKNSDDYLVWKSENSLDVDTTKDDNASWYVVAYDNYMIISNAATITREIWWNVGNSQTAPRFACYEGKTPGDASFKTVSLMKFESVPVRGTLSITAPTQTTMRQGTSGTATYSFTPADGDSATIASHTWTSSNSEVISVSGDTFTAVAPGKAKLTLNATDTNSESYVVSTSDITVIELVSGSYEKKRSVAVGDTVALVCETAGTQFSGITSKIGTYVFYDNAPASVYDFVVEEGYADDTFALKDTENKYFAWSSGTDLKFDDSVNQNSSWTIEFDEDGNATIANCGLDGEDHRVIKWNNSSPRFCPYKTGQTAVQLYGPAIVIDSSAVTFANKIIDELTCDNSGKTAPSVSEWGDLEEALKDVSPEGLEQLSSLDAVHHESPVTDREIVEEALAKYDYVVGKYGEATYTDFLNRDPDPIPSGMRFDGSAFDSSNNMMTIIVVIAATSAIALGTLLIIKKKKHN